MTKEETIKEAYGEYYESLAPYMNENGWCYDGCFLGQFPNNEIEFENIHHPITSSWNRSWRHVSLKGIENNNGWIKIESEDDLPKETMCTQYHVFKFSNQYKNIIKSFSKIEVKEMWEQEEITHYQPIQKPNPPIY